MEISSTDDLTMYGWLQIYEKNNETGETCRVFDSNNKIMTSGINSLLQGVTSRDPYPFGFDGIYIGDDLGGGTLENPNPPTDGMIPSDQNVIYRIPDELTFHQFPKFNELEFNAFIDGNEIYRETQNARNTISSISIRNVRGDIVAYKRFPSRVTSPLITLNISWKLIIGTQCDDEEM